MRKGYYIHEFSIGKMYFKDNGTSLTEVGFISDNKINNVIFKSELITETINQMKDYLVGSRKEFNLPLSPEGTEFQKSVWNELLKIPYAETRSYSEIAINIRNPKAVRAVGMANNKNPIVIIIPCHRVIGKNGDLIGYGSGIEIKEKLLNLEKSNFNTL
jgi:methylated-DNA-[protein]-cysteine S-methyltransferase